MTYATAIVVGGGIAGLATTRVLSDYFDQVHLLDSDTFPKEPHVRRGISQGRHLHTLLPGGLEILSGLFPDLQNSLSAHGGQVAGPAQWYALTEHGRTYRLSRFQPDPDEDTGPTSHTRVQSRPLLELCIREEVAKLPNVHLRDQAKVTAPVFKDGCVTGVRLDVLDETITADLVVDATGQVSQTLTWLKGFGMPRPTEAHVNCDFAYCSNLFEPHDPEALGNDVGFLISAAKKSDYPKRGGSIARVEGNRWQVTLAGRLGDYPPKSPDGFMAFLATLHDRRIHDLVQQATPLAEPHQYLFPKSRRRNYHSLTQFPEGLLPIGDAICHINPGYAQGMSLACRQVAELARLLTQRRKDAAPLDGLWREFFPAAYEQTRAPWVFAALNDFTRKGTTGDFPHEDDEEIAILKTLNRAADRGDRDAAALADAIFDMRLPLSAVQAAA